jgi:GGDEF domain-containing protein
MNQQVFRLAGSLLIPVAILISAVWVTPELHTLPRAHAAFIPHLPYVAAGLGLALSWRFHQSRVFFALCALMFVYLALRHGLPSGLPRGLRQQAIFNLTGVLAPAVLAGICLLPDRGIFNVRALARFALLLAPAVAVAVLIHWRMSGLSAMVPAELLKSGQLGWTPLPTPVVATFTAAGAILLARLAVYRTTLEGLLLAGLIGLGLALHTGVQPMSTAVFVTAIALLFTYGVIQDGYRKAYVDELTSLPGRRALEEQLVKLGSHYVVAMVDVDHFKRFNDTYGHDVGDQVLRMVASQLDRVGGGGRPFRYGGEEFAILFSGKTANGVMEYLEEVRERIGDTPFAIRGRRRRGKNGSGKSKRGRGGGRRRTSVTVSIGLAESSERLAKPQDVLKAADEALYRAKRGGRNRVCD